MRHALALMLLLTACGSDPAPVEPSMIAGQDLDRLLRMRVPLPSGITSAHWLLRIKGQPSEAPGPTDTELLVWIPLPPTEWAHLEPTLPLLSPPPPPRRLHPEFLTGTRPPDVGPEVAGQAVDPSHLDRGPWHAAWAVWTGRHLVVDFHSR